MEVKTELSDNPLPVLIDRDKTTMTFSNLIRNAVEAMQKEPKVLTIKSRVAGKRVEVSISDTGRGIPKDKIGQIFNPFFTSRLYGPGLGLTFARRIIKEHKGTICVRSETGKVQLSQYACHCMAEDRTHEDRCCRS